MAADNRIRAEAYSEASKPSVVIPDELFQALSEWREVKLAFPNRPPGAGAALASLTRMSELEDRMLCLIAELNRSRHLTANTTGEAK